MGNHSQQKIAFFETHAFFSLSPEFSNENIYHTFRKNSLYIVLLANIPENRPTSVRNARMFCTELISFNKIGNKIFFT